MKRILNYFKKIEPDKVKRPFLFSVWESFFTFVFVPNDVTQGTGTHIKDKMDLKRLMTFVVLALVPAYIFGTYNIGQQHFVALGQYTGFFDAWYLKLSYGLIKVIPIYAISMIVGLAWEFLFASKKGKGIEEGFLVTGALIPLIMPPDIPLWILAIAVTFAVVLGKEVFGGTGMNIWNVALLARVFVFFAYPLTISGDEVWVSGFEKLASGNHPLYGWWETGFFNTIFGWFGWLQFDPGMAIVDGFSGATPLSIVKEGGWDAITQAYSTTDLLWGNMPGSIGETSKPLLIIGALLIFLTGIADWRIPFGAIIGTFIMGIIFNLWDATPLMTIPWYYQFHIGGGVIAILFMATDPVSAAQTARGKIIYGVLIGIIAMFIRIINPAYPEGWMLAILFMNSFAPLIDHVIISNHIKKRVKK
ncbi:MAG: NADH:ubiquinone reductase (Na(+)-transporting) subunit B [Saprospiraceae bacterium]|nr:NADH:ubiquinone reductase (Na(+)-transporting) subunit B [Saprospiraceae bacterium]